MFAGQDFDPADLSESEVYCFDFVNDLAPGDSISSATWTCAVSQGTDPNPTGHLVGTPFIVNATQTTQRVGGLLAGVTYILKCVVTTANSNLVALHSHVVCEPVS